jgi:hypothetical protein
MSLPIFPTHILPTALKFRLVPHSGYSQAPNRMVEVWRKPSAYWTFNGQWSRVRYAAARELRVFIDNLEGSAYAFLMWDSTHTQLGNWGGTVRVDGSNQTGTLLHIDGATPNALIAPAGDRFQLDDYLYSLKVDAVADANGECDLLINPQLMTIPADNTLLVHDNPMCKMMLTDDNQGPDFSKRSLVVTDFSIAGFMSMRH